MVGAMDGQAGAAPGGPPARGVWPAGYRTYDALAELVDNSVDARGEGGVCIRVMLDYAAGSVRVVDDGVGMDPDDLQGAVAVARDAGPRRRGPGMGAACSFLGRSFSVSTSRAGSALEHVVKCGESRREGGGPPGLEVLSRAAREKGDASAHGTSILVTALRVPLYAGQTTLFKGRFGERYCDYIRGGGQARIRVNSVECRPVPPDTVSGSARDFELETPSGRVAGRIGLLGRRPAAGGGGLSLYRGDRLVRMHSPFGMRGRPGADRVVGRVSLDGVPVNPRGTGFAEDSVEYLEAERAFGAHPAVADALRDGAQGARPGGVDFGHFYDYLLGRRDDPAVIARRVGRRASRALLASMPRLEAEVGGRAVTVECADAGGPPYERHEVEGGVRYVINRDSPVFSIVKNPLYAVALVGADLRASAGTAGGNRPTPRALHDAWASMVDGLVRGRGPRAGRAGFPPGYSLSGNLVGLRSVLEDCYHGKFEFTGLSTLAPYTHNALASPVYSLYTERGHGEYLCDVIMDFGTGYVPLFDPDGRDIDMWRYASGEKRLVAVREYSAGELSGPIAPPAKAWMDLVREVRLHHMPYMEEDLAAILDMLKCQRMLSLRDLDVIARRRKSEHARGLIEQVFAA